MSVIKKEKLEAYRREKRREKIRDSIRNVLANAFAWNRAGAEKLVGEPAMDDEKTKLCEEQQVHENAASAAKDASSSSSSSAEDSSWTDAVSSDGDALASESTLLTKFTYLLYALLWITLYVIALEYEFGAVYFVLSALLFVCLNTRSRPKQPGEPSAYSVFNPNCEAIDGTLDASQFENEIRYGAGVVR
ncbi:hypothetical protein DMN91_012123 [Ooceraea biroi]|uniref:SAYSvFN domain-containing protein n=1 Tax=Ooceraea biroi TaxID=2015173 RepID=A0A3L8D7B2_OOCBI|nr:SAYSvFN domain-containing protein 1 [Ooceraea biroi]XP_026830251.1 SAYSvFN domain-containing protein 1-like isoform X2 [Ooceraea biroi]RLU15963.1 hypothetical protein DMN91_011721 [Ooceraea biroi]RLU16363.1 hypothetical protein DMN91_012123 [Ooceraea biroi]